MFLPELAELGAVIIDRAEILGSLQIHLGEDGSISYPDLANSDPDELYDLMMKSLAWSERVSEILARIQKRKLDGESVLAQELSAGILRQIEAGAKSTGLKDIVRGSERYVNLEKFYNSLVSYYDYLDRLIKMLDKYHYALKFKLQMSQNEQRK